MASANECQGNVEAAEEYLEFIEKTVKYMKESVTAEGKAIENKEKKKDEHRKTLEANTRTVQALKKALRAVQKSVIGDDAATNGMEKSLEALKETLKSEKIIESDEDDTVQALRDDVETSEALIDVEKLEVVRKDYKEAIEDENFGSDATEIVKEKTTEIKKSKKDKATKSVEQSVETIDANEKFIETWNTILNQDISPNKIFGEINEIMTETKEKHQEAKEHFKNENENSQQIEQSSTEDNTDIIPDRLRTLGYVGMDNPLNAMLFSEQLIEYVLNKLGHTWPSIDGARNLPKESVSIRFSKVIGEAMLAIIDSNIEKIAESYKQLMEKNVHKIDSFRKEVCVTATFFFARGYTHYNFLIYSAQLAGLSAFYFASGNTQIAEASAQVLAYILNHYIYKFCFSPYHDWFTLQLEAQKLRKEIQDHKIEFVLPTWSQTGTNSQF